MKKLKSLVDLFALKQQRLNVFGNSFNYFFENLVDNATSKPNGEERNKQIVEEYDQEAQTFIWETLRAMMPIKDEWS